jgi:hypothetical protein
MRALAILLFASSIGLGLVIFVCVRFLLRVFQALTSGSGDITSTLFFVIALSLLIPFGWVAVRIFKKGQDLWHA